LITFAGAANMLAVIDPLKYMASGFTCNTSLLIALDIPLPTMNSDVVLLLVLYLPTTVCPVLPDATVPSPSAWE
jgi:hypothetical protein